jgi:DnaJ-class molecular chaperone
VSDYKRPDPQCKKCHGNGYIFHKIQGTCRCWCTMPDKKDEAKKMTREKTMAVLREVARTNCYHGFGNISPELRDKAAALLAEMEAESPEKKEPWTCPVCNGLGHLDGHVCSGCGGAG